MSNDKEPLNVYYDIETASLNPHDSSGALDCRRGRVTCIALRVNGDNVVFTRSSEKETLTAFWAYLRTLRHHFGVCLVSYNGQQLDMPFILARSQSHGLEYAMMDDWLSIHRDVMLEIIKGTNLRFPRMSRVAEILGVPHNNSLTGSMMPDLWHFGEYGKIEEHCEDDVRTLEGICAALEKPGAMAVLRKSFASRQARKEAVE